MVYLKLQHSIKQFAALVIALSLMALVSPLPSMAKKTTVDGGKTNEAEGVSEEEYSQNVKDLMHFLEGRGGDYTYRRDGRSDPFMPFLREKVVDQELDPIGSGELVGMQKFEPGQLLVVGIVHSSSGPIAMVQDSTGKGYIISPGIKLGRSGVVDEITENMILIKQQYLMTSGATRHRVVKMMLKNEGE